MTAPTKVSQEQATEEKGHPHPGSFIELPNNGGTIHLQYGHPLEVGRNGCFTTDVIQGLIDNLSVYQDPGRSFPGLAAALGTPPQPGNPMATRETEMAIARLEEALMWINRRKAKRVERGVHQTDTP